MIIHNRASPLGAAPPPPGVTPNFEHPADVTHKLALVSTLVCDVLIVLFFLIRCYGKSLLASQPGLEDYTCYLSMVFVGAFSFAVYELYHYGAGYHTWDVTAENYVEMRKWMYVSTSVYIPAAYFIKVTLLLLIARVFAVREKVATAIHIFIGILALMYLPIQLLKMAICVPLNAFWDTSITDARCVSQGKSFIADGSLAILTDLIILIIPVPLTWNLNLPFRRKLKIVALLGAGGAALAVTIYRMTRIGEYMRTTDISGFYMNLCLTVMLEITIGFVCACLPSLSLTVEHHLRSGTAARPPALPPRRQRLHQKAWWDVFSTITGNTRTTTGLHTFATGSQADRFTTAEVGGTNVLQNQTTTTSKCTTVPTHLTSPHPGCAMTCQDNDESEERPLDAAGVDEYGIWDSVWDGTQGRRPEQYKMGKLEDEESGAGQPPAWKKCVEPTLRHVQYREI